MVYRGHEGVRDSYREWYEGLAEIRMEVSDIRDLGEQVVALGHIYARGQGSGVPVESPGAWVVDWKDGKAVRVREYLDHAKALEAAGLSE